MKELILASASPRRRELLTQYGIPFRVEVSGVDEDNAPDRAEDRVVELACRKAKAVSGLHPGELVLGSDTVVALDDVIMEKPVDSEDARRMIQSLNGRTHRVLSGICLTDGEKTLSGYAETFVKFRDNSPEDIDLYIATCDWQGKAGAYGIQGAAGFLIEGIEGSYTNVVGLPIEELYLTLKAFGEHPLK